MASPPNRRPRWPCWGRLPRKPTRPSCGQTSICREQLDIDSMDFLNFVIGLHEQLGVDIPEAEYPRYGTIDGCVAELSAALARPA